MNDAKKKQLFAGLEDGIPIPVLLLPNAHFIDILKQMEDKNNMVFSLPVAIVLKVFLQAAVLLESPECSSEHSQPSEGC